jgi:hypothetical protein
MSCTCIRYHRHGDVLVLHVTWARYFSVAQISVDAGDPALPWERRSKSDFHLAPIAIQFSFLALCSGLVTANHDTDEANPRRGREGPRWHLGRLWFVDCMERTLLSLTPSARRRLRYLGAFLSPSSHSVAHIMCWVRETAAEQYPRSFFSAFSQNQCMQPCPRQKSPR